MRERRKVIKPRLTRRLYEGNPYPGIINERKGRGERWNSVGIKIKPKTGEDRLERLNFRRAPEFSDVSYSILDRRWTLGREQQRSFLIPPPSLLLSIEIEVRNATRWIFERVNRNKTNYFLPSLPTVVNGRLSSRALVKFETEPISFTSIALLLLLANRRPRLRGIIRCP